MPRTGAASSCSRSPPRTSSPRHGGPYTPNAIADGPEAGTILSGIFRATVEATEEAVLNALVAAHTVTGRDGNTLYALPIDRTLGLMRAAGRLSA